METEDIKTEDIKSAKRLRRQRRLGGCRAVLGGVLIHLILGTMYTWGNMGLYVISHMRTVHGMTEYHHRDLGYVLSVTISGQGVGMVAGGVIESAAGPRLAVYIGGTLLAIGVCLSSFLLHSYIGFILTYGLLFGLGMGISYTAPLACALRWLPDKKGLVSGLITAGLGTSSLVFSLLQTNFINPLNLLPELSDDPGAPAYFTDLALLARVPQMILISSCIYVVVLGIGGSLLVDPPSTSALIQPRDEHPEDSSQIADISQGIPDTSSTVQHQFAPIEALYSERFSFLFLLFFLISPAYTFIASNWRVGPATLGLDDQYLSLVSSIASVCNATGRVVWGQLLDLLSPQIPFLILTGSWAISLLALGLFGTYGTAIYTVCVCANFFCFGGNFALFPTMTAIAFGRKYLGTIYGILYVSLLLGSNSSSFITQRLLIKWGYVGMCGLYTSFIVSVFLLTLLFGARLNKPCLQKRIASHKDEVSPLMSVTI